ncbi:hypothetical protein HDV00_000064 [Rhizophlyctis rosea]|nr:hypothetical protein HDV00_000064 [Rhizophlyctis rosea]
MSKINIPVRKLGKNGPSLPALGLGCMGMSEFYGATNEEENIAVLDRAIDLGCTFWDTADMYGSGKNEELLAKVLKTRRSEVFLCTKFGNVRGPNGEFLGISGTPEYVKQACDASLKRLGVSQIDLYYQHRVDPKTPIEDTVRAMAELVKEGKVKYLGISECSASTLRKAHAIHPIACVQMEYSPWTLDIETNGLLQACRELGIAIVAYSPLGRGFLTGQFKSPEDFPDDDYRKHNPRFQGENFYNNLKLVQKFEELATKKGCKAGQLALAWVMSQGDDFFAIPGTKRIKYLEENLESTSIHVSADDDKQIREIIKSIEIAGTRYHPASMHTVNRTPANTGPSAAETERTVVLEGLLTGWHDWPHAIAYIPNKSDKSIAGNDAGLLSMTLKTFEGIKMLNPTSQEASCLEKELVYVGRRIRIGSTQRARASVMRRLLKRHQPPVDKTSTGVDCCVKLVAKALPSELQHASLFDALRNSTYNLLLKERSISLHRCSSYTRKELFQLVMDNQTILPRYANQKNGYGLGVVANAALYFMEKYSAWDDDDQPSVTEGLGCVLAFVAMIELTSMHLAPAFRVVNIDLRVSMVAEDAKATIEAYEFLDDVVAAYFSEAELPLSTQEAGNSFKATEDQEN